MTAPAALPELGAIERLLESGRPQLRHTVAAVVRDGTQAWPVHVASLGSTDPQAPVFAVVAGVHGLERIGTEVAIAFLHALVERLRWDESLHAQLAAMRIVVLPLLNPGGLARSTRANPNGVDLMRNAPVDALDKTPPLAGGHRLGSHLPWYRGPAGAPMEAESQALCTLVERDWLGGPFTLTVDCHSGFGLRDRVWFPYAYARRPFEHLAELTAIAELLDDTYPQHRYVFEPQSAQYLAHGDLWDHLALRAHARGRLLLPLTLEMGSWVWVRKNPRQVLSRHGLFNPLIAHRQQRVLRRHVQWLEFMSRVAQSHARWRPQAAQRELLRLRGLGRWYGGDT
jgi:predicted deacylase